MTAASGQRQAAAAARRQEATAIRHDHGDNAFRRFRQAAPGIGTARNVPMKTTLKAASELRNGKEMIHTFGFFTRYMQPYPMWDQFGEYDERVRVGAGAATLAANPDVAWLVNHKGVTMARTRNGTLELEERTEGGWHDAWLNPGRTDVQDIVSAIQDRLVDQMSFAFMIPDGAGLWSEDFELFDILAYDIDRGDVSAVNYGASPYTDITARTAEVLQDIDHLPEGAVRAAYDRLQMRGVTLPPRDEISVRSAPRRVSATAVPQTRRLASLVSRTADRFVALAARRNLGVADLPVARLPWYEIRNADAGTPDAAEGDPGFATVFVFDEIGGSFGVNAKTFASELEQITAPEIRIRINSPGGSVFDGLAIHSAILHHPSRVVTYVDGLAASAASVIAMAGDEVVMMPGSEMMIHDASAVSDGNAADLAAMSTFLDRQSANIADLYARKAGGDPVEWRELMLAETWAFAQEAVDLGLADRIGGRADRVPADDATPPEVEERMSRTFDLGGYRFAGRRAAPAPRQSRAGNRTVSDLIEASSLGTPEARALRESTPPEVAERIVERSKAVGRKGRSIALVEAQLAIEESR